VKCKQYPPKKLSCASGPIGVIEDEPVILPPASRSATRLGEFAKVVRHLRSACHHGSRLEDSALTRAERDEYAQLVAWGHEYLRQLLNFSALGLQLRGVMDAAPDARDARLLADSILKRGAK
jgi:hypothetical protein